MTQLCLFCFTNAVYEQIVEKNLAWVMGDEQGLAAGVRWERTIILGITSSTLLHFNLAVTQRLTSESRPVGAEPLKPTAQANSPIPPSFGPDLIPSRPDGAGQMIDAFQHLFVLA